jgi:hypothetical protein
MHADPPSRCGGAERRATQCVWGQARLVSAELAAQGSSFSQVFASQGRNATWTVAEQPGKAVRHVSFRKHQARHEKGLPDLPIKEKSVGLEARRRGECQSPGTTLQQKHYLFYTQPSTPANMIFPKLPCASTWWGSIRKYQQILLEEWCGLDTVAHTCNLSYVWGRGRRIEV